MTSPQPRRADGKFGSQNLHLRTIPDPAVFAPPHNPVDDQASALDVQDAAGIAITTARRAGWSVPTGVMVDPNTDRRHIRAHRGGGWTVVLPSGLSRREAVSAMVDAIASRNPGVRRVDVSTAVWDDYRTAEAPTPPRPRR